MRVVVIDDEVVDLGAVLDVADKVASVIGAVAGVLALIVSIHALREQRQEARTPGPSRRLLWLAVGCAVLAVAVAVLFYSGKSPQPVAAFLSWAAGVAGLAAITLSAWHVLVRRAAPVIASVRLRALLTIEFERADQHSYRFGRLYVPKLAEIYVEQRTESTGVAEEAPALMTVADVLTQGGNTLLIAGPGGGKSTVVAMIVRESARWWLEARRSSLRESGPFGGAVAVRLPAVTAAAHPDLADALAAHHAHTEDAAVRADLRALFAEQPLPGVPWLVMVDGVDEVMDTAARTQLIYRLNSELKGRGSRYRLLVTSRPLVETQAVDLRVADVGEFRLRPFDTDELHRFATRWFVARTPGNPAAAQASAARYIEQIQDTGLDALVRVPLLATMAALVFKLDADKGLPSSRTALFAHFVGLLRKGRLSPKPSPDTTDLPRWLLDAVDPILNAMAAAQVDGAEDRLFPLACDEMRALRPDTPESEWREALYALLLGTSLFEVEDERLRFVHRSVAEYLAAGEREFNEARWRAEMADPARRSLALFTLARSGPDPADIVARLLGQADDDPVCAAYVVADGAEVSAELRDRIIDLLLRRLREEHEQAADCLAALLSFASSDGIRMRLTELAVTQDTPAWVRVLIADALFDIGGDAGVVLIRQVLESLALSRHPAGTWLVQRLQSRQADGVPAYLAEILLGRNPEPDSSTLGLHATLLTLEDVRQPFSFRLRAAEILLSRGHERGRAFLLDLLDRPDTTVARQLRAALTLTQVDESAGAATLRRLVVERSLDGGDVVRAAQALAPIEDQEVLAALSEVSNDTELAPETRRRILRLIFSGPARLSRLLRHLEERTEDPWSRTECMNLLSGLGEEILRDALHSPDIPLSHRLWVARAFIWRGNEEGAEFAMEAALEQGRPVEERAAAARLLLREVDTVASDGLLRLIACPDLPEPIRRYAVRCLAGRKDAASADALGTLFGDPRVPAAHRARAAVALHRERAFPAHLLRAMAVDVGIDGWLRYSAVSRMSRGQLFMLGIDQAAPADCRVWAIAMGLNRSQGDTGLLGRTAVAIASDGALPSPIREEALWSLRLAPSLADQPETLLTLARYAVEHADTPELSGTALKILRDSIEDALPGVARSILLDRRLAAWLREAAFLRLLDDFPDDIRTALDKLILQPEDGEVRAAAIRVLLTLRGADRDRLLLALVHDERIPPGARVSIAAELGGPAGADAWAILGRADVEPGPRAEAVAKLLATGAAPPLKVFDAVLDRLEPGDPARLPLFTSLVHVEGDRGVAGLRALLFSTATVDVREQAARVLLDVAPSVALPALEELAGSADPETVLWTAGLLIGANRDAGAAALERLAGDGRAAVPTRTEAVRTLLEAGRPVAYDLVRPLLGSEPLWSLLLSAAVHASPALDLLAEVVADPRAPLARRIGAVAVVLPSGHPAAATSVDALIGDSRLTPDDLLKLGRLLNDLGDPRARRVLQRVAENRSAPFTHRLEAARSMDSEARSAALRALTQHRRLRPAERLRALNELLNSAASSPYDRHGPRESRDLLRLRARLEERVGRPLIVRIYRTVAGPGSRVLGALASPFLRARDRWQRRAYRNSYKVRRQVFRPLRRRRGPASTEQQGIHDLFGAGSLDSELLMTLERDIERQAAADEAKAKLQLDEMWKKLLAD
ncbi:hypothetical protein ABZ897_08325 [Nonomuraea sp. NPDC046802]|uniref:hypothetical protein n=1 Tax=Nonomuraea sp. NPDC046802 TaxID=3154919 RepID=UPI0033DC12C9